MKYIVSFVNFSRMKRYLPERVMILNFAGLEMNAVFLIQIQEQL